LESEYALSIEAPCGGRLRLAAEQIEQRTGRRALNLAANARHSSRNAIPQVAHEK
jgi:hypothetical protein